VQAVFRVLLLLVLILIAAELLTIGQDVRRVVDFFTVPTSQAVSAPPAPTRQHSGVDRVR